MNIKQARYVAILLKNEIEEHFLGAAVYSGTVAQAISEMLDFIDADLVQRTVARMEHETCPECGWVK
jgi:hypothetical protein